MTTKWINGSPGRARSLWAGASAALLFAASGTCLACDPQNIDTASVRGPEPELRLFSVKADHANAVRTWSDGTNKVSLSVEGDTATLDINGEDVLTISGFEASEGRYVSDKFEARIKGEDGSLSVWFNGQRIMQFTPDAGGASAGEDPAQAHARHRSHAARQAAEALRRALRRGDLLAPMAPVPPPLHAVPEWVPAPDMPSMPDMPEPPRVMIGITMEPASEADDLPEGIDPEKSTLITRVLEGLPAEKAGLQEGDFVVAINGTSDASPEAIRSVLRSKTPGDTLRLKVIRTDDAGKSDERELQLDLTQFDDQALSSPRVWGWQGGTDLRDLHMAEARIDELRQQVQETSEQLTEAARELTRASGEEERTALTARIGELSRKISEQASALASENATGSVTMRLFGSGPGGRGGHSMGLPRIFIDRQNPSAVVVPNPAPQDDGQPAAAEQTPDLKGIDERLSRLEKLLEKVAEKQGDKPGSR